MTDLQQPEGLPNIVAGLAVAKDHPSGLPVVVVRFRTGGATIDLEIDARRAPEFMVGLTEAVVAAAQQAVAQAGPRIVAPPSGLIVPTMSMPPKNGRRQ